MDINSVSVEGTVIDGAIHLDQPLNLANESRVHVTVVPVDDSEQRWDQALAALARLKREQPIGSGGLKFTREQLHERD